MRKVFIHTCHFHIKPFVQRDRFIDWIVITKQRFSKGRSNK